MPWITSCNIMAQPGVATCSIIVWDTKEIKTNKAKWLNIVEGLCIHNPPTGELIFCLIQTCVYFPHARALMRGGDMIEVSIIHTHTHTHTHSPSTYFQPYVLLCCCFSLLFFLYVLAKVQFQTVLRRNVFQSVLWCQ